MRTGKRLYLSLLSFIFILSGCVVRTYPVIKDRVDQDMSIGNQGYLKGQAPEAREVKERKATRRTQVIEVELHSPIKFERMPKVKIPEKTEDRQLWGNRGFLTQGETSGVTSIAILNVKEYKVQRGDTLQKISKKFYGSTKKWVKIYEANKDVLKGPNKIYPGQVINIPVDTSTSLSVKPEHSRGLEPLKETPENLK